MGGSDGEDAAGAGGEFMRRPKVADQRAGPVADSDDDLAPGADHLRAAADHDVYLVACMYSRLLPT